MELKNFLNPNELHHAYAFVGDKEVVKESLLSFVEHDLSVSIHNNPDFWMKNIETVGIDDARELTDLHIKKSFSNSKKIFVLLTDGITIEAQNALLKLFEEPLPGNHFFLLLSEDKGILPTLRSRMTSISFLGDKTHTTKLGRTFCQMSLSERLEMVGKIAEDKDKNSAKLLVRSIIDELHEKQSNVLSNSADILSDLIKAEDYLSDRAPSIKMLLEHIAHTLPSAR